MAVEEPIIYSELFTRYVFPFLLVFTLIFALLEKTALLGKEKKQINAIVSLVVALVFVTFPYPQEFVSNILVFLVLAAVVLLVFFLLYGFVAAGKEGFQIEKGLKIAFGIIIGIALLVALIWASGQGNMVYTTLFKSEWSNTIWTNILFVGAIIAVVAAVLGATKASG